MARSWRRRGAKVRLGFVGLSALAGGLLLAAGSASAQYLGASYLQVPGVTKTAKPGDYSGWVRFEGFYWKNQPRSLGGLRRGGIIRFPAPSGPKQGAGELIGSIDKRSKMLRQVMDACARQAVFTELTFSVNAEENGPLGLPGWGRPPGVPEFYEYKLKNVRVSGCPTLADAPEQAVVLSFADIEWANYRGDPAGTPRPMTAAPLRPLLASGTSKTFVVSWFGVANFVDDKQCDAFNKPPTEAQYYELLPKEEADRERKERAGKGGVSYQDGTMARRGPGRLDAVMLPGIVRDPGQLEPKLPIALGLDLDSDDGLGKPPAGICRHQNFRSPDGRTGIDNQLFRVQGCSTGYQGRRGFLMQYSNEQRRTSTRQIMVHISGIDDEQNDDQVDIAILYSADPMVKSADGTKSLPDYTFKLASAPDLTAHQTVLRGKIVNGAITAASGEVLRITDEGGTPVLHRPAMRFQIKPDGTLTGLIGGYLDWRRTLMVTQLGGEYNLGLQVPGWYNAMRRYADGLMDPQTGECRGISTAYEVDGIPAFLSPAQTRLLTSAAPGSAGGSLR